MATFSRTLEHTLRRALQSANEHQHEYVTLEHLLLSLIDDDDAAGVMHACKVDLDKLTDAAHRFRSVGEQVGEVADAADKARKKK